MLFKIIVQMVVLVVFDVLDQPLASYMTLLEIVLNNK